MRPLILVLETLMKGGNLCFTMNEFKYFLEYISNSQIETIIFRRRIWDIDTIKELKKIPNIEIIENNENENKYIIKFSENGKYKWINLNSGFFNPSCVYIYISMQQLWVELCVPNNEDNRIYYQLNILEYFMDYNCIDGMMKYNIMLLLKQITMNNFEIYGEFLANLLCNKLNNKLDFFTTNEVSFYNDIAKIKQYIVRNGYTITSSGSSDNNVSYETITVKKMQSKHNSFEMIITFSSVKTENKTNHLTTDFTCNMLQSRNDHLYVSSKSHETDNMTMIRVLYDITNKKMRPTRYLINCIKELSLNNRLNEIFLSNLKNSRHLFEQKWELVDELDYKIGTNITSHIILS